jgi:AraC-like DNA-binding protein
MSGGCRHYENSSAADPLRVGEYVGAVVRSAVSPNCHLSIIEHAKSRILPDHAHDWPFVCVLLRGAYVSRTQSREMEIDNAVAVYHPRAFQHCDAIGRDGGLFFGVQLDPALIAGADPGCRNAARDIARLNNDPAYLILGSLFCELLAGADELALDGLAAELASALFVGAAPRRGAGPPWLKRIEERLQEEVHVSLAELARDAGVHSTTLTRQFRLHKQCSIGEFQARAKAKHAFLGVVGGAAPLAEVSLHAGYADQSHMTREFKKTFGRGPGAIRRELARRAFHEEGVEF